jgi:hypothetical protein
MRMASVGVGRLEHFETLVRQKAGHIQPDQSFIFDNEDGNRRVGHLRLLTGLTVWGEPGESAQASTLRSSIDGWLQLLFDSVPTLTSQHF